MEAVAGIVAEAALSAAFDALFDKLSSQDVLKYARRNNVKSEVDRWSELLPKIKCVLDDAEERQISDRLIKIWLDNLRDLSYDVEDILDEFYYEVLRQKVTAAETEASTSKVRKLIHTSCSCFSPREIKFNVSLGSKMKEITERFEAITKEKENLGLTERATGGSKRVARQRIETSCLVQKSQVYGRKKDEETLVNEILSSGKPVSVVAIVGMGGLGKTTLAQLVYNEETVSKNFNMKAWVCVSDEFDVLKITVKIVEAFTSTTCDMKDLNNVQKKLQDLLHGGKFLLVLDDVWNEDYLMWDALSQPLAAGGLGSKVLITTRIENVASIAGAGFMHPLKKLELEECLSLLAMHAFGVDTFSEHPSLQEVGEQMAKKCDGLPLAAKAIGGLLRGKSNPREWLTVLNSNTWVLARDKCPILPALFLSYYYLPSHLKRCFAYCAIFPKDYKIDKDDLILLWMAQGFLEQSKHVLSNFDEIGNEYFKDLLSRSFFQASPDEEYSKFVMHDLMNDLAVWVSEGTCLHLPTYEETNYAIKLEKPRHLSFMGHDNYECAKRFEKFPISIGLRTFIVFTPRCIILSSVVLGRVTTKMKYLKLLCWSGYSTDKLPDSISELKHLRHLDMSYTCIKSLPESVCDLLYLEVLNLNNCRSLVQLPRELRKLINLRLLDIRKTENLKAMPSKIGRLKNLQILSKFIVGEKHGLRLNELKDLSLLRGKLSISGLEKVGHVQEARDANLKAKECLVSLKFEWAEDSTSVDNEKQVQILDELHPDTILRSLKIYGYNGNGFPKWVGDCRFTNLETLTLLCCRTVSSLPPLGGLMSLKELNIIGLHEVKRVGKEVLGNTSNSDKTFPSLQTLNLKKMNGLEEWCSCSGSATEVVFPRLQKMEISNCPVLVGKLPNHLTSLEELRIIGCPNLRNFQCSYPSLQTLDVEDCSEATLKALGDLTSLRSLNLKNIREMVCMEELLSMLGALQELEIKSCGELKSLVRNGREIEGMVGLQRLTIESCDELVSFGGMRLPSSLKQMSIYYCSALKLLPEGFMVDGSGTCESALEKLTIWSCPTLTTFPRGRFPDLLANLSINKCENLQSMPEFSNSIKYLEISGCHHLRSLPEFSNSMKYIGIDGCPHLQNLPRFPASLESLKIKNLTSLASESTDIRKIWFFSSNRKSDQEFEKMFLDCSFSLESLRVWGCNFRTLPENITSFKRIKNLEICSCKNLRRLPKQIHELNCLRTLTIMGCSNLELLAAQDLPQELESLHICGCGKVMEGLFDGGLSRLVSLTDLDIDGGSRVLHIKPEAPPVFLPKLQSLTMANFGNVESLAAAFKLPSSIERLFISKCPKLQALPIHELSSNLGHLGIDKCPLLKKRCLDKKGEYWPLLSIIPMVYIDGEDLSS